MAKKKEDQKDPIISSIPVPPSDSALVIDLPDGQKLLVGKIETGTVIEVATWRGTGRPDSRTNRLMLGMSNESNVNKADSEVTPEVSKKKQFKFSNSLLNATYEFSKKLLILFIPFLKKVSSKIRNLDLKNFNLAKFMNIKWPEKNKLGLKSSGSKNEPSLMIDEEDFDKDFQRILDEVSQRRKSPLKNLDTDGDKKTRNQSSKSKKSKKVVKKRAK